MEDWVTFLLVNIVLVIVLGVITNMITPSIKSAYDRRIFFSRKKKIEALKKDYRLKRFLHKNLDLLAPYALREFVEDFLAFIVTSIISAIFYLWRSSNGTDPSGDKTLAILLLISLGYFTFRNFWKIIQLMNDSLSFSAYQINAREKIKRLDGNPEDLDREETEQVQ